MCGILGIIGKNIEENKINLKKIKYSLNHRGPDNAEYYFDENVLLIHNRLSIIDLDERSNQPFFSKDKTKLLVFNGEIYNYLELKHELIKNYKCNFLTQSDTEVLLTAFEIWGEKCLDKLDGMFSFTLFDIKKKQAFFARDRFGQKPFFYWLNNSNFYFSSEVTGLMSSGYTAEPDNQIWYDYLKHSATDHSRKTFFKNIFQLLPGECGTYSLDGNLKIKKWYDLSNNIKKFEKGKSIKELILDTTLNSIKISSRSDVPISLALSGGLDSTILMSLLVNKKYFDQSLSCYSINFEEPISEKNYIDISTSNYNIKSKFINFSEEDFLKSLVPTISCLESPSGGLMNLAMAKICSEISKDKIKVVLDGTGPDEAYGGYEIHHIQYLYHLKKNNKNFFEKNLKLFCKNWNYEIPDVLKKIQNIEKKEKLSVDAYEINYLEVIDKDFELNISRELDEFNIDRLDKISVKESLIEYIQKTKIPRNCRLLDRVSMAFGVEMRFPFLEHKFMEAALSIDTKAYFLNGNSKSIFRHVFRNINSREVLFRKKQTIQSPQNKWIKSKKIKEYINDILLSKKIKERGIFDIKNIKLLVDDYMANDKDTSFKIWQILNTELWFQIFIDNKFNNNEKKFKF